MYSYIYIYIAYRFCPDVSNRTYIVFVFQPRGVASSRGRSSDQIPPRDFNIFFHGLIAACTARARALARARGFNQMTGCYFPFRLGKPAESWARQKDSRTRESVIYIFWRPRYFHPHIDQSIPWHIHLRPLDARVSSSYVIYRYSKSIENRLATHGRGLNGLSIYRYRYEKEESWGVKKKKVGTHAASEPTGLRFGSLGARKKRRKEGRKAEGDRPPGFF